MTDRMWRRDLLRGIGVAATAGVLAGCSTDTREGDGGGEGGGGDTPAATATAPPATVPSEVESFLSEANLYEGSVVSAGESPTVMVGAGNGFAFDAPAISVSTGTTVTWEWTGNGGNHNVVAQDGTFDSGETIDEKGHTFEYTFENSGDYLYFCEPHKAAGMKGAVLVR